MVKNNFCREKTTYYFLVMPDLHTLDFGGPVQAIHALNELELARVKLKFIGPQRDTKFFEGLAISNVASLPERVEDNSLIIISGSKWHRKLYQDALSHEICDWLTKQVRHVSSLQLSSICTGAFLLGEAGFLDGRRCTTHHALVGALEKRFPKALVQKDRLFVRDHPILTSAGVSAGVDMMLDIIREQFGDLAAVAIARDLVLYMRRSPDDPQLSIWLEYRNHLNARVHSVQDAIIKKPEYDWRISDFASLVNLSERQITRIFRLHTGVSIKTFHVQVRLELTKELLKNPNLSIDEIADRVGFKYSQNLRRAWNEHYGNSPSKWRRRHQYSKYGYQRESGRI